ncbi:C2 domain containing protein [Nitzschia inconspicua]|uniref:C2 domain containing protein n=1 Tax=Nitzschia inconspicua TaxID=303405 RepID=A0A9K3KGX2_9STRA|nr:C2 domain containing protein [Nitzschia inconspicua]
MTGAYNDASETTPLVTAKIGKTGVNNNGEGVPNLEAASSSTSSPSSPSSSNAPSFFPVLVELIGLQHVPVSNMETYCVMQYGVETIHRTKPYTAKVTKTEQVSRLFRIFGESSDASGVETVLQRKYENPIWTIQHDAVFSCTIKSPNDIDSHKALTIQVWARPRPLSVTGVALGLVTSTAMRIGSNPRKMPRALSSEVEEQQQQREEDEDDDDNSDHDVADDCDNHDAMMAPAQNPSMPQRQQSHRHPTAKDNKIQFIGKVRIPAPTLLGEYCTEQRIQLPLQDELGRAILHPETQMETMLSLRCRIASQADLCFARTWSKLPHIQSSTLNKEQDYLMHMLLKEAQVLQEPLRVRATLITELPEYEVQGSTLSSAMVGTISPINRGKVKVKPYPDQFTAETQNKTQYLTPTVLKTLTKAPSRCWIQAGSTKGQKYGRLYVEVLSAHGLPNVDFGQRLGNQTDAFCCLIYGDCMAETDVIDDELSPHWLPWTQRAFCFALGHPSQVLYLGVFGYKRNPMQHAPIGRVEINITNLQHDTLYELHYDLSSRSHKYNGRVSNGTIRVRIRVEVDDERQYLLASLLLPPSNYINSAKKKSMRVARYTAMGEYDNQDKFQLAVLQGYIDEILQGYVRRILYALTDGMRSLVLWRNQIKFGKDGRFGFPLYSLLVFCMSVLAIEIPNLIPGMIFLGLALFMLAQMQIRIQNNPSPLKRCFGFWYYLKILVTGKTTVDFEEIKANHGLEEIRAIERLLQERIEKDREFFGKKEAVEKVIEEIENERVATNSKAIPLELMTVLGKVQGIVGGVCRALRFVDTIITWEESDISFFFTSFFIVLGFIFLFIPWTFIFAWTGRLAVFALFGPQNKIVDLVYFRRMPTDEQKIRDLFMERMLKARVQQEENRKLKAFRHALFGKYATTVPSIMWTPHNDFPIPSSSARYHGSESYVVPRTDDLERCPFIPGQKLFGVMIPRPEDEWRRNEEESMQAMKAFRKLRTAKATKQKEENNNTSLDGLDISSVASQEGFEVMDLYDEELGFVKKVLTPQREESTRELGVEILQNSGQELRFEDAYKSVHDFNDLDSLGEISNSTDVEAEEDEDVKGMQKSNTRQSYEQLNDLNVSKNGNEITEGSDRDAMFVQRSWRRLFSRSLNARLPSVRFSSISIVGHEDLSIIEEMDTDDAVPTDLAVTDEKEKGNDKGSADSTDMNDRFIDALLSDKSVQDQKKEKVVDGDNGGDASAVNDQIAEARIEDIDSETRLLLAQYGSPSFDSASVASYTSSYGGDRSAYSMTRETSPSVDDSWTLNDFLSRETTFTQNTLDRIGTVLYSTTSGTSFTESQKETSQCEEDEAEETEGVGGPSEVQERQNTTATTTTIQMSSNADLEECGFEIFES